MKRVISCVHWCHYGGPGDNSKLSMGETDESKHTVFRNVDNWQFQCQSGDGVIISVIEIAFYNLHLRPHSFSMAIFSSKLQIFKIVFHDIVDNSCELNIAPFCRDNMGKMVSIWVVHKIVPAFLDICWRFQNTIYSIKWKSLYFHVNLDKWFLRTMGWGR